MDRDALDAFFAQAEDVLTDWDGSVDAMHVSEPVVLTDAMRGPSLGTAFRVEIQLPDGTWQPIAGVTMVQVAP